MPTKIQAATRLARLFCRVRSCCEPPQTIVTGKRPTAMHTWITAMSAKKVVATRLAISAVRGEDDRCGRSAIVFDVVSIIVVVVVAMALDYYLFALYIRFQSDDSSVAVPSPLPCFPTIIIPHCSSRYPLTYNPHHLRQKMWHETSGENFFHGENERRKRRRQNTQSH